MRIGVDLDGTAVDFDRWCDQYNLWFGKSLAYSHVLHYPDYDGIVGLTHFKDRAAFWRWASAVPNFFYNLPPMRGALGALYELQKKHELVVVTHRKAGKGDTAGQTRRWLEDWWPGTLPELVMTDDKLDALCDVYIDDNPSVLAALEEHGGPHVIRYAHGYNLRSPGIACDSWAMVREHVALLAPTL